MSKPRKHPTDLDLLNAVREQIAADPDISQTELRARIGGTTSVVGAAMHAVYVETGRTKPGDGSDLDPRFAALIRVPQPPPPLDLRAAVSADLYAPVTEYLAGVNDALERVIDRVHQAALDAVQRERDAASTAVEAAERRAARADEFVDSLRREVAEAAAETERVRAEAARGQTIFEVELARQARELSDARAASAHADELRRAAVEELLKARETLKNAHEEQVATARELAASDARVHELERQVLALSSRLDRTDSELGVARAAESEARSSAAAALAKLEMHDTMRRPDRRRGDPPRARQSRHRTDSASDSQR